MKGHCLCGAVQLEFEPKAPEIHACHCEMCRRWAGSAFVEIDAAHDATRIARIDRFNEEIFGKLAQVRKVEPEPTLDIAFGLLSTKGLRLGGLPLLQSIIHGKPSWF